MRSSLFLPFLAAAAAATLGPVSDDWRDYEWSSHADPTADEYLELDGRIPSPALPVTEVTAQSSYVAKLPCVGCPFIVRPYMSPDEYFQNDPENSLLLNFTIGNDARSLELNNMPILPFTLPTAVYAFQVPANLTSDTMQKMVDMQMMDKSFNVGTKYGMFELSYEHTTTLDSPDVEVLRFNVTNVDITSGRLKGGFTMSRDEQKAVELQLTYTKEEGMRISSIGLVGREDAILHGKMACGKDAPVINFVYRTTEWDYYGHIGSWSRTFSLMWEEGLKSLISKIPLMIIVSALCGAIALARKRSLQRLAEHKAAAEGGFFMVDEEEGLLELQVEKEFDEDEAVV
ncbi:hypothetical protein BJ875DRAFT_412345 [Amylocarpus encephaloides]|uniref:Uncharacterized protein n=1 Tax=Amylocarpus encephaloides TaxID=45428 RepID=A0A9P8BZG8_9HELO|nr:hypothetical protein BJ875DRAFT_412345 [Amylocarpus encephaloides]